MRARIPIACTALLFGSCWSSPPVGPQRTPLQSLQRPLTQDLTTAAFAARTRRLAATWAKLSSEPGRIRHAAAMPGRLLGDDVARADDLAGDVTTLFGGDLARGGELGDGASTLLRHVLEPEGDDDHRAAAAARLLGVDRPPLGEISDRRHRTDPDDDRPEASLWQRIVRRLRL